MQRLIILTLLVCTVRPALAEEAVAWESLSAPAQALLQDYRDDWRVLPEHKQKRLRAIADRWQEMPDAERRMVRARMERWRNMKPEKKQRLREKFERFKQLSPEEKTQIRKRREWFRNLPEAERRALRENGATCRRSSATKSTAAACVRTLPNSEDGTGREPGPYPISKVAHLVSAGAASRSKIASASSILRNRTGRWRFNGRRTGTTEDHDHGNRRSEIDPCTDGTGCA